MRIAQIVLPGASFYEQKSQRIDWASLAEMHEVSLVEPSSVHGFDVAHVYGPPDLPRRLFVDFPVPYVANGRPVTRRFSFRQAVQPEYVVSPELVPEAVEDAYFVERGRRARLPGAGGTPALLGTFRGSDIIGQTLARIHRFRDDIEWVVFDHQPSSDELQAVDAWVDPSSDYDGFTAEALVAGLPVVASRTPINLQRLEKGRTGWLVPPGDANELVHAILTALFKPEVAQAKINAARQTRSKFQPRQRIRILAHMYDTLGTSRE